MKTVAHIKLDPETKTKAQKLAKELGFSLSGVINAQLKQFVRDQKLSVSKMPEMSLWLEEMLAPIEEDIKNQKNISRNITSAKDLDDFFAEL